MGVVVMMVCVRGGMMLFIVFGAWVVLIEALKLLDMFE